MESIQQDQGNQRDSTNPPNTSNYCGADNELKPREPIRCRECGHRVMYKRRTTRMIQFEAR
ncbi:hypothetical protein BDF19DRAFT_450676 [Syncephalis fuscata]|nr:hypothetical protein BDF19DRAFT_450676 [Syncephalis fuscata]